MEGGGEEAKGMIPRAVEQIFVSSSRLTEKGWQVHLKRPFSLNKRFPGFVLYM